MAAALKGFRVLMIVLPFLCLIQATPARAQELNATADNLESVRLQYEDRLEFIRGRVFAEIDTMYKEAAREADPVAARERVERVEGAFRARGELPDIQKKNAWINDYNKWKALLERAYATAIEDSRSAGNEALVQTLSEEQKLFASQMDLVPWGVTQARVRPHRVVVLPPPLDQHPSLQQRLEDFAVHQLIPQLAVQALPPDRQVARSSTASPAR